MKLIINASIEHKQTLWNKIKVLFGGKSSIAHKAINPSRAANLAYEYADAMIAEREKKHATAKLISPSRIKISPSDIW